MMKFVLSALIVAILSACSHTPVCGSAARAMFTGGASCLFNHDQTEDDADE